MALTMLCSIAVPAPVGGEKLQQPERAQVADNERQQSGNTDAVSEEAPTFLNLLTSRNLQRNAKYCGEEQADKAEQWRRRYLCEVKYTDIVSAFSSFVTAALTLGLIIVGVLQFLIYRRQASIMSGQLEAFKAERRAADEIAIRLERAYVFVVGFVNDPAMTNAQHPNGLPVVGGWIFRGTLQNTGNTPARLAWGKTDLIKTGAPLDPDHRFPYDPRDGASAPDLGPKSVIPTRTIVIPIQDLERAIRQELHLYLWGWIEYDDTFPTTDRHRTEFCVEIKVRGNPNMPVCAFETLQHGRHNGSDETYQHQPSPHA